MRFRMDFAEAMLEDLRWLGLSWSEGPDVGGPHAPYEQSRRRPHYRAALERLHAPRADLSVRGSRRDVLEAAGAPHEGGADDEPIYPAEFRPDPAAAAAAARDERISVNWRLRVPDGEELVFVDGGGGPEQAVAGQGLRGLPGLAQGRHPELPAGLRRRRRRDGRSPRSSGARTWSGAPSASCCVYRALGLRPPGFYHCPLLTDDAGVRLAKRHDALSLRNLREQGMTPDRILAGFSMP